MMWKMLKTLLTCMGTLKVVYKRRRFPPKHKVLAQTPTVAPCVTQKHLKWSLMRPDSWPGLHLNSAASLLLLLDSLFCPGETEARPPCSSLSIKAGVEVRSNEINNKLRKCQVSF